MKILFVTNMYPSHAYPTDGIFIKEQIDDIHQKMKCDYDIYYIRGKRKSKLCYIISILLIPYKILTKHYDVVHIHYGISGMFLLFFKPRTKTFITLHGSDILHAAGNTIQVFLTKRILSRADRVFIQNRAMEETVKLYTPNYEIIPCGVNTDFFYPKEKVKGDRNVKTIVFPSSPDRWVKNFPLFEEVVKELMKSSPFKIIYRCIDKLSRAGVRELLTNSDCLLMTSKSEGSPQVIKEALACGIPVVSVPVGDVRALLQGVPNCYVSNTSSQNELCRLVELALIQSRAGIREAFIGKQAYDNHSITDRLTANYLLAQNSYGKWHCKKNLPKAKKNNFNLLQWRTSGSDTGIKRVV